MRGCTTGTAESKGVTSDKEVLPSIDLPRPEIEFNSLISSNFSSAFPIDDFPSEDDRWDDLPSEDDRWDFRPLTLGACTTALQGR
mmetsp:Transcript_58015/g.90227  ORF Transcript_58015/g.90227 Transcript_58015/m.90227 type:complete len:85 (+) Transcript_58015:559-813(+)